MGIDTDLMAPEHWEAAFAALDWQVELGVQDWVLDEPLDRYALPERLTPAPKAAAPVVAPAPTSDPLAEARALADRAHSLDALREALTAFDLCELKKGARNTVFADGTPGARVMVIGEPPSRDEDLAGRPFAGPEGALLDKMFAAIGLARSGPDALYLCPLLPWRPPSDREPSAEEVALMRPFLDRHVALADPQIVVLMGNGPCKAVLGASGILRLRGQWATAWGRPVLPMTHPTYLLRQPMAKREAWADLLSLKARL